MKKNNTRITILGCGHLGAAIADGLVKAEVTDAPSITLTRRRMEPLLPFKERGFNVTTDNNAAVKDAEIILLAITPQLLDGVLETIAHEILPSKHTVLSAVSGVSIKQLKDRLPSGVPVVRVMPNTAIAIRQSMTCISADEEDNAAMQTACELFDNLGKTMVIHEDLMVPATALCACGIAFFLRAVRAASQGGIEIGFHAEDALFMAAQTAKGAAALLVDQDKRNHPEREVDKVTTPQGCTISGLNCMEHSGFSSSMIKGIVTSAEKAEHLYNHKSR